jgi:hypothetical protein
MLTICFSLLLNVREPSDIINHWVVTICNPPKWELYSNLFEDRFGVKISIKSLSQLYVKVAKEKHFEEKVKKLHDDGIVDCFLLTESLADTLIEFSPFFNTGKKTDFEGLIIFLSYKTKVYFDDKQIEKIISWFSAYKVAHKHEKKSTNNQSKRKWSNEEIDTLRDIAIEYHVWEKSEEIYKRNFNFSAYPEIFNKFDENLGGRSFSSVKQMLLSKDFFTRKISEIQSHLSIEDEKEAIKLVQELFLYTQSNSPELITRATQQVLDYADTIEIGKLFGKSEEVGDILEEESIEKEIDQKKKKPKYTFKMIIKIASLMLQKEKSFTGSLMRFYWKSKHCLIEDIKKEAKESMKQGNGNEVWEKEKAVKLKKLLNILDFPDKKVFDLLEIEMPLSLESEKTIMKKFNVYEIVNGEKNYLSKDFMLEKRKESKVDAVTGKIFGLNEPKCCEHPHESSTSKSGPWAGFVTRKTNLLLQNYNGCTLDELDKEKSVNDLYRQTPLLNSVVKDVNGVDMKVTVELVETQAEFARSRGEIVLLSKPGSWVYPCIKSLILYSKIVIGVPDHSHWLMKLLFPKEVQETKLAYICNESYRYYRIFRAVLHSPEILSKLEPYELSSTDVEMFQASMLSKWIDTKKELDELDEKYILSGFGLIILPPFNQKTQREMFEKTLRNSLAPHFNMIYPDTQEEDNQCYEFRAERLKNPTGIHIEPKEIKENCK